MVQTATNIIPPSDTSRAAEPEFRYSELEQTIPSVPLDRDAFSAVGTSPGHAQVSDDESTSLASDSPEQTVISQGPQEFKIMVASNAGDRFVLNQYAEDLYPSYVSAEIKSI
ncbi:hypothetical protein B0H13DRAFT_1897874 [Mycena leptocephala]|nr:hypothetical protein B0H13DRAFT_1897874 [Mycena leptocephala]